MTAQSTGQAAGDPVIDDDARRSGTTEVLGVDECWQLLREGEVGRLAVHAAGDIDIFPLNYAVDGDGLVFRTSEGTKLVEVVLAGRVAFEIDGYEPARGRAWSVVAKGAAHHVDSFDEMYRVEQVPVFPWNAAPKERYVRLQVSQVTGRRFTVAGTRDGGQPRL